MRVVVVEGPGDRRASIGEHFVHLRDRLANGSSEPRSEHEIEVERLMELIGLHELEQQLGLARCVGLAHRDQRTTWVLSLVGVDDTAPAPPIVVCSRLKLDVHVGTSVFGGLQAIALGKHLIGKTIGLARHTDRVDTEPLDSPIEPERERAIEVRLDVFVLPVPVGLPRCEHVQVPLPRRAIRFGDASPGRATEDRGPVVGRKIAVRALAVAEPEPIALTRTTASGDCIDEPLVLRTAVVRHDVEHDANAVLTASGHQTVEVGQRAVRWLDVHVVGDVVAVIHLRRREARAHPDRVDTECLQIRQVVDDALQVALAVAIGIGERAHVHLIHDGIAPPGAFSSDTHGCSLRRTGRGTHDEFEFELLVEHLSVATTDGFNDQIGCT